jgi:hypothetical protein
MLTMHRAAWPKLYADCLRLATREGYARPSRVGETIELGPAMVSCPAPVWVDLEGRGGSSDFARVEQLEHLAGVNPTDAMLDAAPHYTRWREPNGTWYWPYGPRLAHQLPSVVTELARRPFSRRAVASIWQPTDVVAAASQDPPNVPCAVSIAFWIGPAGEVRAHANVRSQDLWLGFYYDMPSFAFLQRAVAKALRRVVGHTYLTATSFHLYTKDVGRAGFVRARPTGDPIHASLPEPRDLTGEAAAPVDRLLWLREWAKGQLL